MSKKTPPAKSPALHIEHKWVKNRSVRVGHGFVLIAYIAYGHGIVKAGNRTFDAAAGDIFVIASDMNAEFISREPAAENYNFEIHFIIFEKAFLLGEWARYADAFPKLTNFFREQGTNMIVVRDSEMKEIRNFIVRMTHEYYADAPSRGSALLGHMLSMLPVIFRRYAVSEDAVFSKNTLVDESIRQIHDTIYQNPKPGEIAAHRFVTTDHLGRVFKQETGMTVTQYINKTRVEITKDILENTDRPIEHIPMLFNMKLKYLQQIFKRYTGMSMREYRSKYHYR